MPRTSRVVMISICAVGAIGAVPALAGATVPGPAAFSFKGSEQTYTVPAGATEIRLAATGAAGGSSCGTPGGQGAQVSADLAVAAGQVLYVEVGGAGATPVCDDGPSEPGGWNGGGATGTSANGFAGSGGGGASDVRTVSSSGDTSQSLASRLIVAGGGGGAAGDDVRGGDAGSAGGDGTLAGGPGITSFGGGFGGAAGAACALGPGADPSNPGTFGAGGASGNSAATTSDIGGETGGGGGGGYYGGGAGGTDDNNGNCDAGSGGGGSSFVSGAATDVTDPVPTSAAAGVTITPLVSQAATTPTRLTFRGTQPEDTVSAPQNLTVRNTGTADLHIGDVTTTGADPGDFLITGCRSAVPPGGSCQFQVRFVPEGKDARTATMDIFSDDPEGPATVSLAGMGGSLPAGPQGPPGPRGKPGQVELITCHTVTVTVHSGGKTHKVARQKCTGKLISGPVKFTVASSSQATLRRGSRVYARGTASSRGVVLRAVRSIASGRYTLVLRYRSGKRWRVERVPIVVR
jgi:Glycine rich protein